MVTLATAVDATEDDWDLSGPLATGTKYLLVEDELVQVITPAVRVSQRHDPLNKTVVKRNVAGTAATHAQGTTLTEMSSPPLGAGQTFNGGTITEPLAVQLETGDSFTVETTAAEEILHVRPHRLDIRTRVAVEGAMFALQGVPSTATALQIMQNASGEPTDLTVSVLGTAEIGAEIIKLFSSFSGDDNIQIYATTVFIGGSDLRIDSLPTADPTVAGQLWNDGGTLKVSAG